MLKTRLLTGQALRYSYSTNIWGRRLSKICIWGEYEGGGNVDMFTYSWHPSSSYADHAFLGNRSSSTSEAVKYFCVACEWAWYEGVAAWPCCGGNCDTCDWYSAYFRHGQPDTEWKKLIHLGLVWYAYVGTKVDKVAIKHPRWVKYLMMWSL